MYACAGRSGMWVVPRVIAFTNISRPSCLMDSGAGDFLISSDYMGKSSRMWRDEDGKRKI